MANETERRAQRARTQARQELAKAAVEDLPKVDPADPAGPESLEELVKDVSTLRGRYARALQQLEKERSEVERRSTSLEQERSEWDAKVSSLAERERKLIERLGAVTARELDAETGFADKEHRLYEEFRTRTDAIREELSETASAIAKGDTESLVERLDELRAVREELERSFAVRMGELTRQEEEYERKRQAIIVDRRKLVVEQTKFRWDQEGAKSQLDLALAAERTSYRTERQAWDAEREKLREAVDRLAERRAALEQRERESKFVDPLRLEADRDALRAAIRSRDEELSRRPAQEEFDGLLRKQRELETQRANWNELLDRQQRLAAQLESTRAELAQLQLVDTKNENLRREKASLASEVDELRKVLGELTERRAGRKPFQLCSAIDQNPHLQAAPDIWEPSEGLPELVNYLERAMSATGLYYDDVTVRSFLAGMHASRLHILQGISGTGKSSLPQAIAAALGVECAVVEVQAAWRDRQDLLGYFNPFEHRFEETPFTVALYRAQAPKHRASPFFVVLDEMNLSHPEQYLADVLSAMERPEGKQALRLMNHASPEGPLSLREGMLLPLPPNVWIVGTANHDETTVSFAPKTYDRSHVFELPPKHPAPTDGSPRGQTKPVALRSLKTLFAQAVDQNRWGATTRATEFLDGLRSQLASMHVGWGNRIDMQLRQYAPIVTGADGTVREAVDVFVSHKILNKLEGRYDFRPAELKLLRERVLQLWPDLPGREDPDRIAAVLDREEARLS